MNNPFQPRPTTLAGGSDNAASPSVGFMASSAPKPPQPLVSTSPAMATAQTASEESVEKAGWLSRIFGRGKKDDSIKKSGNTPGSNLDDKAKEAAQAVSERKPSERDLLMKRHEDLMQSVNDICKSLENSRAQKVEVSVTDLVSPFPVENLDALTRTQEAVSGVLEKVSGRLDQAGARDGLVVESLKRVDGSLLSLSKVNERSITSMDGVKGALGNVNGSMEAMQVELKRAGKRYEELCEKVQNSDKEHSEVLQKLQRNTLIVNAFLGVSLVGCVIAVIIAAAG